MIKKTWILFLIFPFGAVLSQTQPSPKELLYQGISLMNKNEFEKANGLFKQSLLIDSTLASSKLNLGNSYFRMGQFSKAIQIFNNLIDANELKSEALYNRALCFEATQQYNLALTDLEYVERLEPNDKNIFINMGNIFLSLKKFNKAQQMFAQALSIDNKCTAAYLGKAIAEMNKKKWEEANKDFNKVIRLDSSNADAFFYRAQLEMDLGKYKSAQKDLTQVIQIDSANVEAYFQRGIALFDANKEKSACIDWNTALKLGHQRALEIITKYCQRYSSLGPRL